MSGLVVVFGVFGVLCLGGCLLWLVSWVFECLVFGESGVLFWLGWFCGFVAAWGLVIELLFCCFVWGLFLLVLSSVFGSLAGAPGVSWIAMLRLVVVVNQTFCKKARQGSRQVTRKSSVELRNRYLLSDFCRFETWVKGLFLSKSRVSRVAVTVRGSTGCWCLILRMSLYFVYLLLPSLNIKSALCASDFIYGIWPDWTLTSIGLCVLRGLDSASEVANDGCLKQDDCR